MIVQTALHDSSNRQGFYRYICPIVGNNIKMIRQWNPQMNRIWIIVQSSDDTVDKAAYC